MIILINVLRDNLMKLNETNKRDGKQMIQTKLISVKKTDWNKQK